MFQVLPYAVTRGAAAVCAGAALLLSACGKESTAPAVPDSAVDQPAQAQEYVVSPVNSNATAETRALYTNLMALSSTHVLFGHQDTVAYGVTWIGEANRSDIKDVTGSFPAIYGWDIGHLELGDDANLDGVPFELMSEEIRNGYRRGSISTISWHMRDPATGGSSWDKARSVTKLLPGGEAHETFKAYLDAFAQFNAGLVVENTSGEAVAVPIIFRPWHEHNGDWFWWGKGTVSEREYVALWRFTYHYLTDEKGANNLLWAFSPDRSRLDLQVGEDSYLYAYPGDEYVDILGIDNYWDLGHPSNDDSREEREKNFVRSLEIVSTLATRKGKLAALTEGGQETVHEPDFWTGMILDSLLTNQKTRNIAYLMVWRNANREKENRDHFYAPYEGHASAEDFRAFRKHYFTLFADDLPQMYQ